jgi:diapolycopene oxygenase
MIHGFQPGSSSALRGRPLAGRRVVVVGGGLGGLAVAVRLAARGARVTVCEQRETFGGKMNRWAPRGYRFDTGPSLITMPWVFEDTFAAAGARLADHVQLVPVNPLADYHFADGARLTYTTSMPEWLATVRAVEPRDVDGFWRFLRIGARIFELSQGTFFRTSPWTPPDRVALRALRHLPLRSAWGNYHRMVAAHFRSPLLQQLFDRYPTYVGSSPYHAPATLAVIPYIEHAFGGWYVTGGLYRIVEGLVSVAAALGVRLESGARVERIEQAGTRVHGVTLAGGRRMAADLVVLNADASSAASLLGEGGAEALPQDARSLSGLVFLLALDRDLPQLPHHAVYFSADYRREFDDLFVRRRFPDEPTVYVNVPSRVDRTVAPATGGEVVFVMANAPATDAHLDPAAVTEARRRVFDRLRRGGFPDLEEIVAAQDVWTPERFAREYGAPGGAIYGTHSHGWRRAFLRPPNRDRTVRGLYYVGGSTHPGGGTPTVLMSARITANLVEMHA